MAHLFSKTPVKSPPLELFVALFLIVFLFIFLIIIIFEQKIVLDLLESREGIRLAVSLNWKNRYDNRKMHPLSEAENVLIENNSVVQIQKNISKSTLDQQIGEFLGIMLISQDKNLKRNAKRF